MFTYFRLPSLVKAIMRKTKLVLSSQHIHTKKEEGTFSVSFYLSNDADEEVVNIRYNAVSNGTVGNVLSFEEVTSITVEIPTSATSCFKQEVRMNITDDSDEEYLILAVSVAIAKLLKSK